MMHGESDQPPSARVRLEVAFLDDGNAPAPTPAAQGGPARFTVLVVSPEPDVRRYIVECLRGRGDLGLLEAPTLGAATAVLANAQADVLIIEGLEEEAPGQLPALRTIVIVDDVPYGAGESEAHIRQLSRPFSAGQLVAEMNQLLSTLS